MMPHHARLAVGWGIEPTGMGNMGQFTWPGIVFPSSLSFGDPLKSQ
jgi:hypothetical protein